jgi:hypothetical protein
MTRTMSRGSSSVKTAGRSTDGINGYWASSVARRRVDSWASRRGCRTGLVKSTRPISADEVGVAANSTAGGRDAKSKEPESSCRSLAAVKDRSGAAASDRGASCRYDRCDSPDAVRVARLRWMDDWGKGSGSDWPSELSQLFARLPLRTWLIPLARPLPKRS